MNAAREVNTSLETEDADASEPQSLENRQPSTAKRPKSTRAPKKRGATRQESSSTEARGTEAAEDGAVANTSEPAASTEGSEQTATSHAEAAEESDGGDRAAQPEAKETEPHGSGGPGRLVGFLHRLRMPDGRRPRLVLAAALAVLIGGGTGGYLWSKAGDLPEGVAFRAEGQNVTTTQLKEKANRLKALYGLEQPTSKTKQEAFWRSLAQADAVRVVLSNAAERKKVVVADRAAQDVITRFVAQQYGTGPDAEAQFLQALGNAGTSKKDVLEEIKYMLATNQMYSTLTAGTSVTDKDVHHAFTERRSKLATPEQRNIHNIVVSSEATAKKLVSQLSKGANFDELAKKHSLDDATRSSGGDLGEVQKSTLDPTYAKAAFAAEDKAVFGPVKTPYGWNVGKVFEIKAPVLATYNGVRKQLKQTLIAEKATTKWRKWITQQIHDAKVQYAPRYRPADPDALPDVSDMQKTGLGAAPSKPAAP
ncbi:peptidylprolyl isomerase [Streptomyces sp. NPDC055092]